MGTPSFSLAERVRFGELKVDPEDLELHGDKLCVRLKVVPTGVYYGIDIDGKYEYVHRVIMNYPHTFYHVDHRNRDTTDNRKVNLRLATVAENNANRGIQSNKISSKFKGVFFYKRDGTWEVRVSKVYCGRFKTEKEAACKYNEFALQKYGAFAVLNIVD